MLHIKIEYTAPVYLSTITDSKCQCHLSLLQVCVSPEGLIHLCAYYSKQSVSIMLILNRLCWYFDHVKLYPCKLVNKTFEQGLVCFFYIKQVPFCQCKRVPQFFWPLSYCHIMNKAYSFAYIPDFNLDLLGTFGIRI